MKHANFLTGLVVGALVFGGTSAYAAGILAEYSTNHIFVDGQEDILRCPDRSLPHP